ncbi:Beta-1,3-glucanase [Amycolatopsis xylanica]|uniref:Beta-1,3-glucanase n=1 Tax=Amycolatopsis xylanica TaxID=589385 RepID=A0A1H3DFZ3_9PSEU|nr:glycoside hydrolase family 64 protein [Amycolatopsis xylanica]SDX65335.1 Beta-1,3-glucanase [Amycolatopsis xylanica]
MSFARRLSRAFVLVLLLAGLTQVSVGPAAAADYTQGVTPLSNGQAKIWFKPTTPSSLVDVHYLVPNLGQQNFRMANVSGTWEQTVSSLSSGTVIEYWFTYEKGGPLYDTGHFSYTYGGGGGTPGGGGTGTFPLVLQNNTRGKWTNAQIYVLVLGMGTPGEWSYLKPNGTLAHINHTEASAPGHLTKNGVNYANMQFTLAQASTVTIPSRLEGGRIYISAGSPMYIPISPDDRGWGGPDLHNPADPNADVYFDWYELTYSHGVIPYGGNTTQVDMFGFPMTARLQQSAIGYDQTVGITQTRDQVLAQYQSSVGAAFKPLAGAYRITAPRSSGLFAPGGAQQNYLQAYIDQVWNQYTASQFTLTRLNQTFTGRVVGGRLQFTKDGAGPFVLDKPTTRDVVECSGALASAGMTTTALELGAEFCAAFNRGVAANTANWYNPAAYYSGASKNDYAQFFHTIGIDHRAYGFAYDDINDQSSVKILPNANPPTALTLSIGW